MKSITIFILSGLLWLTSILPTQAAHFSVTDALLIKTNVANARRDLVEQILQFENGAVQIEQLLARVRQAEDLLERMGKPESIKDLPGFGREINAFLKEIERSLPSFEIIREIDPDEAFKQKPGSPYEPVRKDIVIDGKKVAEVDARAVLPELATRRTIAHYQAVRNSVLEKRSVLKGDLELAMNRLQSASTSAEVDKLNAVINGLKTQLAVNDADMEFAANEVATRHYQNLNEEQLRRKVQVQKDRADFNEGMKAHLEFFALPSKPTLFKTRN